MADRLPEKKLCFACQEVKPAERFYVIKNLGDLILSGYCRPCSVLHAAKWRKKNPAKRSESGKRYHAKYRERLKGRYQQNKGRVLAQQREYYLRNRERKLAYAKAYRLANLEQIQIYHSNYRNTDAHKASKHREYLRHREAYYAATERRRARKRNISGSYSEKEWTVLKARYGNRCLCCGRDESEVKLTADHVIPLTHPQSSGGIENIQPLCRTCNGRKGTKTTDYRPRIS